MDIKFVKKIRKLIALGVIEKPSSPIQIYDYDTMISSSEGTGWTRPTQAELDSVEDAVNLEIKLDAAYIGLERLGRQTRVNGLPNDTYIDAALDFYNQAQKTQMKNFVGAVKTEYQRVKNLLDVASTEQEIDTIMAGINFPTKWEDM